MTTHELNIMVSDLLQFSVPRSILERALENHPEVDDLDKEDIDALCDDVLEMCQAFDAGQAYQAVLGARTPQMIAEEFELDSDEVDEWLTSQEKEAVKYGLEIDFSSLRAEHWHADIVRQIQSHC